MDVPPWCVANCFEILWVDEWLFVHYQAFGTPGRAIKSLARETTMLRLTEATLICGLYAIIPPTARRGS